MCGRSLYVRCDWSSGSREGVYGDGYARLRGKGVSRGFILLKGIVFGNIVRAAWDNF